MTSIFKSVIAMLHYISKCTIRTLAIKCKPLIIELEIWEKSITKMLRYTLPTPMTEGLYRMSNKALGHQYWSGYRLKGTVAVLPLRWNTWILMHLLEKNYCAFKMCFIIYYVLVFQTWKIQALILVQWRNRKGTQKLPLECLVLLVQEEIQRCGS